jgi:hypothetical protein
MNIKQFALFVVLVFTVGKGFDPFKFNDKLLGLGIDLVGSANSTANGYFTGGGGRLEVVLFEQPVVGKAVSGPFGVGFKPGQNPLPNIKDGVAISSYTATIQSAITAAGG